MRLYFYLFLLVIACKPKLEDEILSKQIPEFIRAYSNGHIDLDEHLFVQFADNLNAKYDTLGDVKVYISPNHPIQASFKNHLLKIEPSQPWTPGTAYVLRVDLGQMFDGLNKTFTFSVETKRQFLTVDFDEYYFQQTGNTEVISLKGHVQVAVRAALEEIIKTVTFNDADRSVPLEWDENLGENTVSFSVQNLPRKAEAYELTMLWNGEPLGLTQTSGKKQITIPAIGDFFLLNYGISDQESQELKLQFSEPLSGEQDYTGLVTIEGTDVSLKFQQDVNILKVYPSSPLTGEFQFTINGQLKSHNRKTLDKTFSGKVVFESLSPAVRNAAKGHILPVSGQIAFPFEAVNLKKIDVEVYRIYQSTILQFLQVNSLASNYELERVANRVYSQTIDLSSQVPAFELTQWNRYQVDLTQVMAQDPQGVYQIKLSFRPQYALVSCDQELTDSGSEIFTSAWDYPYYGPAGYYQNFWQERNDPCKSAYYNEEKFLQHNILASNLGLMAKRSTGNSFIVVANHISDATPVKEVKLDFYDFALQLMGSGITDAQGVCIQQLPSTPAFIIGSHGNDKNYLQLLEGSSLPISKFDVSGETRQDGMRCFIFGERGVWRPGDTIFMHAILDAEQELPANYPLKYKFLDPLGKPILSGLVSKKAGSIYAFPLVTSSDASTGDWTLRLEAGAAIFYKRIKVESIKPNRLKINYLRISDDVFFTENIPLPFESSWLHGGQADNLRMVVERKMRRATTVFKSFPQYHFDDITRSQNLNGESEVVFEGKTDQNGQATVVIPGVLNEVAGKVEVELLTRVFEPSGEASIMVNNFSYSPYSSYVGVYLEGDQPDDNYFAREKQINITAIKVNEQGSPLAKKPIEIGLYKIDYYYWWESEASNQLLQYSSGDMATAAIRASQITDAGGKTVYHFSPNDYGSYLIKICDPESGHCASKVIYVGEPWLDGNKDAAMLLSLKTDKVKYQVNEVARLTIPALNSGKALITIERGSKVLKHFWRDLNVGQNVVEISLDQSMAPASYISVALLQGYNNNVSDLPIRQYGIVPIEVDDPDLKLEPVIQAPEETRSGKPFQVTIKERKGKAMDYVLALVDEGLLGLTAFKTPDPNKFFHAKEALQVNTWDLYDQIFNLQPSEFGRLLAIGGDEESLLQSPERALRFEPAVRVLGPFSLPNGRSKTHDVLINKYIGEIRAMVIAVDQHRYGHQQKGIKINNPVMVLASLPRTISPGAQLLVPVNIFTTKPGVGQIKVTLSDKNKFAEITNRQTTISINKEGDELIYFELKVPEREGEIRLVAEALSGNETVSHEINLSVRNPNPIIRDFQKIVVSAQGTSTLKAKTPGSQGTNTGILELSYLPPLRFKDRLEQLIQYPYGCAEQQISAAYPQLFLEDIAEISFEERKNIQTNVQKTIHNLSAFQNSDGGFSLWPRQSINDEWVTSYVGHFLLDAQQKGYHVPSHLLEGWKKIQKRLVKSWDPLLDKYQKPAKNQGSGQIYRLYTLALAGSPEIGSMNKLVDAEFLSTQCKWELAAAYAVLGKKTIADKIIQKANYKPDISLDWDKNFGSALRDEAIILDAVFKLGKVNEAFEICKSISKQLEENIDNNTQDIGFTFAVLGKVYKAYQGDQMVVNYRLKNGSWNKVETKQPVLYVEWSGENFKTSEIEIQNQGGKPIFAHWTIQGQPVFSQVTPVNKNISTTVKYLDVFDKELDVSALTQGMEVKCVVTVMNTSNRRQKHLALNQTFPIGWEIVPQRLGSPSMDHHNYDYQDVRDDRVYTFFDLNIGEKKVFSIRLTATYPGRYQLPPTVCEAMYDPTTQSIVSGKEVQVIK